MSEVRIVGTRGYPTQDRLYAAGWKSVCSADRCRKSECGCNKNERCKEGFFNHYMVDADVYNDDPSFYIDLRFPIQVAHRTIERVGVEEIGCKSHTLGSAYAYYRDVVMRGSLYRTIVSVVLDEYKSACFNMPCYAMKMPKRMVKKGWLAMEEEKRDTCWVISRPEALTTRLLECLCAIGICPDLSKRETVEVPFKGDAEADDRNTLEVGSFSWPRHGPNIILSPYMHSPEIPCWDNAYGVEAVKTAIVTMSVVLTPEPKFGGRDPDTKSPTYFVHNVCYGREVQHMQK